MTSDASSVPSRSMGRERGDKPLSTASSSSSSSTSSLTSRPGPFARGGSSKELLEGPEEAQEEKKEKKEVAAVEPRRPSVAEEKPEPERSRAKESGEEP